MDREERQTQFADYRKEGKLLEVFLSLIDLCKCIRCCCKPNLFVRCIEYGIKSLQEGEPVDEV